MERGEAVSQDGSCLLVFMIVGHDESGKSWCS